MRRIRRCHRAGSRQRRIWNTFCDDLGDPSHPQARTRDPRRHADRTLERFVQQHVVPGAPPPPTSSPRPGSSVPGPGSRARAPALVVPEEGGAVKREGNLVGDVDPWWLDREATALGCKPDPGEPGGSSHTLGVQEEVQVAQEEVMDEEALAPRSSPAAHDEVPAPSGSAGGGTGTSRTVGSRPTSPALRRPPGRALLHSLSDPRNGGPMYKVRLTAATLDQPGEAPSSAVARLQGTLGAVFSAAWHGYAALHPAPGRGRLGTRDPRRHPEETCRGFLSAWQRWGYDAYAMDRELGLSVDWARVRAMYLH